MCRARRVVSREADRPIRVWHRSSVPGGERWSAVFAPVIARSRRRRSLERAAIVCYASARFRSYEPYPVRARRLVSPTEPKDRARIKEPEVKARFSAGRDRPAFPCAGAWSREAGARAAPRAQPSGCGPQLPSSRARLSGGPGLFQHSSPSCPERRRVRSRVPEFRDTQWTSAMSRPGRAHTPKCDLPLCGHKKTGLPSAMCGRRRGLRRRQ
jgi:hypothetical protein